MKKGWVITIAVLVIIFLGIFVFNKLNPIKMTGNVIVNNECGFYNSITINDSLGDASLGSPSYVDIKSLSIKQIGQYIQFIWERNGKLSNEDKQYYFIFFDEDSNLNTGQNWGGKIGAEIKISVDNNGAAVAYFDSAGNVVSQINNLPVFFEDNKFYLNIERNKINLSEFNLYFETSGDTPYVDEGKLQKINLQTSLSNISLNLKADKMVLDGKQYLVNIPNKTQGVKLNLFCSSRGVEKSLSNHEIIYSVFHPVTWKISPEEAAQIISIDSNGVASYLKEGYVFASAFDKTLHLSSNNNLIIATGDVFGNPNDDSVIAIFPKAYVPNSSSYSFKYMMGTYPNYLKLINSAYNLESQLYLGFKPFNGEKQIFALLDLPGHCGGNKNPLETAPCCYMDCGSGTPQYNVVIHEMGHNFAYSKGMDKLMNSNNSRIGQAGFGECVASLPVIYFATDFYNSPEKYGFNKSSYEWNYYKNFLRSDIPGSNITFNNFESSIKSNTISGIFDSERIDGVSSFCSFFQQYSYNFTSQSNPYGNEVIKRFLNLFGDKELSNFKDGEVETYFSAAYSAAVGSDMRDRLRFWGFTIDDSYFNELYSTFLEELNQTISSNSILTCKKFVNYTADWQSTKCNVSDCGKDIYVGCNKKTNMFNNIRFQEICQRKEKYQTECSINPSCGSDAVVNKIVC